MAAGKRGRPAEPQERFEVRANLPAASTPADELKAVMADPQVLAWLAARAGYGLACPRTLEVVAHAGRKPRLVIVRAR